MAKLHAVSFDRSTLTAREAALLELVLEVAAVASAAHGASAETFMTFVVSRAAQLFPETAFEVRARPSIAKTRAPRKKRKAGGIP